MEFPGTIQSKLPKVGTTIFTVMSKMAREHNAVNLSQGFPDFEVSAGLIDRVSHYMKQGANQYAPMSGQVELREQIVQKVEKLYGAVYHPETEVTVTAGATEAIYTAITAIVKEEDEVIVFTPAYDCYVPAIELCGGKAVYVQLKTPDYSIDWEEVKKVINRKTKMIIVNTPHNPTGTTLKDEDMRMLEKLTKDSGIVVLSDEVYEHIIFDRQEHQSACRFPELAKRTFVVASFGKTFHATGWKIGYCLGPEALMEEFRKVHQFVVFSCNTPVQLALADFIADEENYMNLGAFYQEKRDYFLRLISGSKFKPLKSEGTYFQVLDYSNISDKDDLEVAEWMTKEKGVASIPVSVFYHKPEHNKVLRFCFAKGNETLEKAAELMHKL